VRKIQLDGKMIKELRDGRDRAATQKEFAHEIRVSERQLRAIKNKSALVTADVADRIAHAVDKPLQILLASRRPTAASPTAGDTKRRRGGESGATRTDPAALR
jgi:plasmid maintenance system antidote protein VapI